MAYSKSSPTASSSTDFPLLEGADGLRGIPTLESVRWKSSLAWKRTLKNPMYLEILSSLELDDSLLSPVKSICEKDLSNLPLVYQKKRRSLWNWPEPD
ncbi:hypothetical protein VitviT2T_019926 [Vitis vinifera]|uniref:Uncharacterized protein n=1 Tax=Vitis vinifera TaxID=29760 RepID=A0ABY9D2S8_VITVI|nr:hypothetical protein VitviT2T_019926 [Vitis vinifera]